MTAEAIFQCLPFNYYKPIMAKLSNSQLQAWKMMLSQNAMQLTLSYKKPAEAQEIEMGGG